jgi:hypothetical protein
MADVMNKNNRLVRNRRPWCGRMLSLLLLYEKKVSSGRLIHLLAESRLHRGLGGLFLVEEDVHKVQLHK